MRAHAFCLALLSGCLAAQTAPPSTPSPGLKVRHPQSTLTVDVREVTVDVSVFDGNGYTSRGKPIAGLTKDDFQLFENGRPQTLRAFEAHTAAQPARPETSALDARPDPPLTVILVDQASLGFENQPWVLKQVTKFVRTAPPAAPIALFALTPGLRVVQGFTLNHPLLLSSLNSKFFGVHASPSPYLQSENETELAKRAVDLVSDPTTGSPEAGAQLARLQTSMAQTEAMQRTNNTLTAFQQIAHYLLSLPGRKNLIWIASDFTERPFGLDTEPDPQFKTTADLLQAARVAVFPLDARTLETPHSRTVSAAPVGIHDAQSATTALANEGMEISLDRNQRQETLDEIADRTGGEAYYNTNDLAWAMNRIVAEADTHYTLTYSSNLPPDAPPYRKLQVRLKDHHGGTRLIYRRGYFANQAALLRQTSVDRVALEPYMEPGMPALSQIQLTLSPQRAGPIVDSVATTAGQNRHLQGPLTRFNFALAVSTNSLAFTPDPNGTEHADLVLDLVAYNENGEMKNWLSQHFTPALTPDAYKRFQQIGLQLAETLDLPPGKYLVRAGVYDLHTKHVGTLDTVVLSAP